MAGAADLFVPELCRRAGFPGAVRICAADHPTTGRRRGKVGLLRRRRHPPARRQPGAPHRQRVRTWAKAGRGRTEPPALDLLNRSDRALSWDGVAGELARPRWPATVGRPLGGSGRDETSHAAAVCGHPGRWRRHLQGAAGCVRGPVRLAAGGRNHPSTARATTGAWASPATATEGMVGEGMVGEGMVGEGMAGEGMAGEGMAGEGMAGEGWPNRPSSTRRLSRWVRMLRPMSRMARDRPPVCRRRRPSSGECEELRDAGPSG
jgi:hypothetical protein